MVFYFQEFKILGFIKIKMNIFENNNLICINDEI